ncbi:MAG: universal stress protein [Pseudomonadota bacterium]
MKRFTNILVVIDAEAENDAAVDKAIWLAKANDARLTLLDAVAQERGTLAELFDSVSAEDGAPVDAAALEDEIAKARLETVGGLAERCRAAGLKTETAMRVGPVFVSAIRQALSGGHDLVMKTASGGGDQFFLSDDLHLMRKCPSPVWIVQGPNDSGSKAVPVVLAVVDPDPEDDARDELAHTVLTLASSMAERTGAALHVVNAWRLQEEATLRKSRFHMKPQEVDAIVDKERRRSDAKLSALLGDFPDPERRRVVAHRKGLPGEVAPAYAEEIGADTIIMGTVARTGVSGFIIGNNAETILNRVRCSVMTVKPPGFVSPVNLDET